MSLSTNVSNLATRIATEVKAIRTLVNGNVADLSALDTTAKNNLVAAINEVKGLLDTAAGDITALEGDVGTLSLLTTTDKTDLVSAINELQAEIDTIDLTGLIDDSTIATDKTWSSFKINSLGTSSNSIGELVKRNSTGGFDAGNVTIDNLSLSTLSGNVINSSQGVLEVGNYSQNTEIHGQGVKVLANSNTLELTGYGVDINSNAGDITIDSLEGNVIFSAVGGVYVGNSQSSETEVATKGYVDTAEADAVTTANAYTDSRINDTVTSTTKTWSSSKISTEISGAVAAVVDMAPAALDTLNELAAALGDDANYASTVTNALAAKADDQSVVHLTGAETIAGVKTFSDAPVVPDSAFAIAKITGLQAALDAKASTANVGDTTTNYVTVFEAGLV